MQESGLNLLTYNYLYINIFSLYDIQWELSEGEMWHMIYIKQTSGNVLCANSKHGSFKTAVNTHNGNPVIFYIWRNKSWHNK